MFWNELFVGFVILGITGIAGLLFYWFLNLLDAIDAFIIKKVSETSLKIIKRIRNSICVVFGVLFLAWLVGFAVCGKTGCNGALI